MLCAKRQASRSSGHILRYLYPQWSAGWSTDCKTQWSLVPAIPAYEIICVVARQPTDSSVQRSMRANNQSAHQPVYLVTQIPIHLCLFLGGKLTTAPVWQDFKQRGYLVVILFNETQNLVLISVLLHCCPALLIIEWYRTPRIFVSQRTKWDPIKHPPHCELPPRLTLIGTFNALAAINL